MRNRSVIVLAFLVALAIIDSQSALGEFGPEIMTSPQMRVVVEKHCRNTRYTEEQVRVCLSLQKRAADRFARDYNDPRISRAVWHECFKAGEMWGGGYHPTSASSCITDHILRPRGPAET